MEHNKYNYRLSALFVAIGQYDDPGYEELKEIPLAAQELADVLVEGGYQHGYPELLQGGEKETISPVVQKWLQDASEMDTLLLYWAGHEKFDKEGHYLIAKDSPVKNLDSRNAILSAKLGMMIANSLAKNILLVLDTAYSGDCAVGIAGNIFKVLKARPPFPRPARAFGIIASSYPLKKAQEAIFCRALTALLAKGDKTRRWTDNDKFIRINDLAKVLQDKLGEPIDFFYISNGISHLFIPNPRYQG